MDVFTKGLWIITLIWFIVSMIKDKERTINSMNKSRKMMDSILGQTSCQL
ncbi:hypothetical protein [Tissierella sp.]|nr:hypothetical protein [Tissierella sp.]